MSEVANFDYMISTIMMNKFLILDDSIRIQLRPKSKIEAMSNNTTDIVSVLTIS